MHGCCWAQGLVVCAFLHLQARGCHAGFGPAGAESAWLTAPEEAARRGLAESHGDAESWTEPEAEPDQHRLPETEPHPVLPPEVGQTSVPRACQQQYRPTTLQQLNDSGWNQLEFHSGNEQWDDCSWWIECPQTGEEALLRVQALHGSGLELSIFGGLTPTLDSDGRELPIDSLHSTTELVLHTYISGNFGEGLLLRFRSLGPATGNASFMAEYKCAIPPNEGCNTAAGVCCTGFAVPFPTCDACPAGRWSEPTTRYCQPCEPGAVCPGGPLSAAPMTVCDGGWQPNLARQQCERCPAGRVRASGGRSASCTACAENGYEEPNDNQSTCICKAGHFYAGANRTVGLRVACLSPNADWDEAALDGPAWQPGCVPCEGRAYECVDCRGGYSKPVPLAGYGATAFDNGQMVLFECPPFINEARGASSVCLAGGGCAVGSTGPLCQICVDGYAKHRVGGGCKKCSTMKQTLQLGMKLLGAILGSIILTRCACGGSVGVKKVGPTELQERLIENMEGQEETENPLSSAHAASTSTGTPVGRQLEGAGNVGNIRMSNAAAKGGDKSIRQRFRDHVCSAQIILSFAQVAGQLGVVLQVQYPVKMQFLLGLLRNVVALDFLEHPISCLGLGDFYVRYITYVYVLPATGLVGCALLFLWDDGQSRVMASRRLQSNLWIMTFLLYPAVCQYAFSAFACRRLAADSSVLAADYSVQCYNHSLAQWPAVEGYPQDYVVCVAGAAMAVLFVVLGVPLYTWVEIRRRAATLRSVPVPGPVSVAIANELELDGGSAAAVELMVQVELVSEYGFLVDAFRPGCETWELFDMLRKMVLIGLLTVCVPGSLFQLWVTSLVALCFLAAHFKKWPYKLQADNILKALAESLIFITVLFGLILDNPELEDEPISEPHYDYALIGCYAVLPCGFLLAVSKKNVWLTELSRAHKSSIEEAGLSMATSAAAAIRYAHHLHEAGLGTEKDRAMLRGLFAAAAVRVEAEKLESLAKEIIGDDNHAGLDIVDHGQKEEGQRLEANAVTFRWRPLGPPQPLPANVGDDRVATAEPTHNEALQEHAAGSQATAVTQSGATFNADGHQVVQIKGRNWEVVSWPYDGYVQLKCKSMKKRFSLAELADLGIEILGRTKAKAIALAGPRTKLTNLVNTINTDEMSSNANGGPAHSGGDAQEVLDDHKPIQDRCHKFTDGFEASFADAEFLIGTHASLDRLIGPPHLDVEIAVKDEHCAVTSGFGASDTEVEASSYHQLRFTPRKEYAFVMNTSSSDAGEEEEQGRVRVQVSIDHLLHHAAERINAAFSRMGWTADGAVTQIQLDSLRMQRSELVALRLATGPMFVLYNTVLRAAFAGGGVVVQGSPFAGQDTKGRFITTIHAINSGIVKLRSLQPACNVYRAVSGSQLPPPFVDGSGSGLAAMLGFKVAVEPGFVAATVHKTIAVKDATGQDETIAKRNNVVLLECRMGLLSRGAFIGWLSQYPTEAEVLLPPVCALEMLQQPSPQSTADGSQTYAMQLHASLKPLTLEQVRAVRQKQCSELAGLVSKDLTNQVPIGDVPSRQEAMRKLAANIVAEADPGVFQENSKFFETTEAVLAQLPRPGDHLTTLWPHRRPVFALAAGLRSGGGGPVLLSGSWDSTTAEFGREPTTTAASEAFEKPTARGSAVLSLALLPGYALAAIGMLNGTVEIISAGGSGREERPPVKLSGHGGPVLALAWLGSRRWLACGSATGVIIWELSRDEPSWSVRWRVGQGEGTVKSLCWTHAAAGRPWLTIATLAGGATLWDIGLTTMDVRPKLKLACRSPVTSMADLGRQLATGTAGRTIVIWALTDSVSRDSPTASVGIKAGAELAKQLHAHGSGVTALAGLSGARLASGGADNLVKLWALPDNVGRLVHLTTLAGHDGPVYALAVLEAEGWLASGGGDGSVRLWRVAERRLADPEAALLLAGASDDTAARKVTAQDRKQVDAIFDWLNHADGSGFVKCGMMQKLAGVTGGELSADDFALICDLTGCDPRQGLSKAGLLSCYTELSLGDLNEDYRLLGLDRSSISGQMTAMRAASKMLKGRDTRSHATEQQNLDAVAEAGAHVELPIIPRLPAVDVSPVQTKFKKAALVAAAAAESTDLTGHYLNEDKELADPAKRPVRDEPIVSEMSDIPPLRLSPATSENSRETEDHSGLLPPAAVTEETAGVDHDMSNEIDEDNDAAAVTKETAADVYDVSDEIDEDDHAASTLACELEGPAFCQFHGKGDFVPVFALLKAGGQLKLLEHVSGGSEIASASVLGCKVGKPKKSRKGYTDALRIDMAARSDGELGPAQPAAKCIVHFECERGRWFTELDKYAGMTDDDALAEVAAHAAASAAASPRAAKMSPRASHAARKRAAGQLESAAQCQLNGEGAFIEMRAELHEDPQNSQLGVSWLVLKDADNGRPFFAGSVLGCRVAKPRSRRVGHERALRLDMGNGANAKKLVIEFDSVLEERWTSELKQLGGMSRVRK